MKRQAMVRRWTAVALSVRNLAAIAQNLDKSNISYLYQEKSHHEADMIRGMKRRVILRVKKAVSQGHRASLLTLRTR
jgi:hypothetical protein